MDRNLNVLNDQEWENMGRAQHVISVEDLYRDNISSMERNLQTPPRLLKKTAGSKFCTIFRVPQGLVEINEKAYPPRIVSIGPYHHGRDNVRMIEEHKWQFLGAFVSRTRPHGLRLEDYYKAVASKEAKIRDCYSEAIDFDSHSLVQMMLLDGVFIIELFCKVHGLVPIDREDPLFNMTWVFPFLMRDLLKLENQIPFFVLQTLFDLSSPSRKGNGPSLAQLTLGFFNYATQRPAEVIEKYYKLEGKHLLDLFRLSFIRSHKVMPGKNKPVLQLIPSARKLHLAGIKFRTRNADSFLDINFRQGFLEIPVITIDDFTSSVILNCIAFEQCHSGCSKHVTDYATFMGCLINTEQDAGFLCERKIIENYFGTNHDIAHFFNNISKDVAFDIQRSSLANLFERVNEYCRNHWSAKWAGLKHTYFHNPWSLMAAIAAVTLIVLTAIQTFTIQG